MIKITYVYISGCGFTFLTWWRGQCDYCSKCQKPCFLAQNFSAGLTKFCSGQILIYFCFPQHCKKSVYKQAKDVSKSFTWIGCLAFKRLLNTWCKKCLIHKRCFCSEALLQENFTKQITCYIPKASGELLPNQGAEYSSSDTILDQWNRSLTSFTQMQN